MDISKHETHLDVMHHGRFIDRSAIFKTIKPLDDLFVQIRRLIICFDTFESERSNVVKVSGTICILSVT